MANLNRLAGAEGLTTAYGYIGETEAVTSGFDSKHPWNGIQKYADDNGNVWVRIPKFYTSYRTNDKGHVYTRYITDEYVSDDADFGPWHLNPVFIDENGKELPYIEIAAYQLSVDADGKARSISGVKPTTSMSIARVREAVDKNNSEEESFKYKTYDIWTSILEQDLFLIENAFMRPASVAPGQKAPLYMKGNGGTIKNTGETDALLSPSGISCTAQQEDTRGTTSCMRYRYIENLFGNGRQFVDGITFKNGTITVTDNQGSKVSSITAPTTDGEVDVLTFDRETKLIFPTKTNSGVGFYRDSYDYSEGENCLYRGSIVSENNVFAYTMISSKYTADANVTFRMIRYPKQN